jgi:cytochrome c oxidase assembly protein subunit 19
MPHGTCRPQRGSFPLDHDGECKSVMAAYLACLRSERGRNDACRGVARGYLQCRMERGLMAVDEMKNLGFGENGTGKEEEEGKKEKK